MSQPTVLIIEDDPDLQELLEYNISSAGFTTLTSEDGERGLSLAKEQKPDLIILDIMLPGMDGISVLKHLRADDHVGSVPVLMLTAKSEEDDIVQGLDHGADDYMTKPFSPKELVARIKSILRRAEDSGEPGAFVSLGPIKIDTDNYQVWMSGKELSFTLTEFNILKSLISSPGRVFSRNKLIELALGTDIFVIDRNVDVHVRSIRKKLAENSELIQTIRGVGYKWKL